MVVIILIVCASRKSTHLTAISLSPWRGAPPAGCKPGTYWTPDDSKCEDCPLGSFCQGGVQDYNNGPLLQAIKTDCDSNTPRRTTTKTKRSTTVTACLNNPGYYYIPRDLQTPGSLPTAAECAIGSYSVGLKKQTSCSLCPAGFTTSAVKSTQLVDCGAIRGLWHVINPLPATACTVDCAPG